MKQLVLISILLLSSCSTTYKRTPSSIKNTKFLNLLDDIESSVDKGTTSVTECSQGLSKFYSRLYDINSKSIELESFSSEQIEDFVKTSFLVRIQLKERMKILNIQDKGSLDCLHSIKNIVRALRYLEDYFIELDYTKSGKMKEEFTTFKGEGIHFLKNPKFGFENEGDLLSGDVILSRGNAYSSAAIARIGDNDTQFSHLTLVYKDKKENIFTTEAHTEIGNVVAPFDLHIKQGNARTVLFRTKDKRLAHEAGKYMYNKVKTHKEKTGKNILYDFAMDYHDDSKIFCSEVVYAGYKEAGKQLYNKEINLPMYKTKFNKGIVKFIRKIGVQVTEKTVKDYDTFGPGEIQFDPDFDIVAEWRNPHKIRDTRFKDAVLTKIFEWMENDGYQFRPTVGNSLAHSTAWLLRRSKWTRALIESTAGVDLADKFPINMTVEQMNVFVVLDKVGEAMYNQIEVMQNNQKMPLSFKEIYRILDDYRAKDFKIYQKYRADKRVNLRRSGRARHNRRVKLVKPGFHLSFRK